MDLPIVHLSRIELHCKLQEKLHLVTGPLTLFVLKANSSRLRNKKVQLIEVKMVKIGAILGRHFLTCTFKNFFLSFILPTTKISACIQNFFQ